MKSQKITDTLMLIEGENKGKFPFSHSILVEDDVCALIDTGCGIETLKKIQDTIDIVINSHSHPDHAAGNWLFSHIPLKVPVEEVQFNSNIHKLSERYAGETHAKIWRDFVFHTMDFRNAQPTDTFHEGDVLLFGTTRLEAVHTPGHSVGHYCFFERSERILFSFDIDLTTFGPWYGNRESDINQFKMSIEKVRALNPEVVVSSHRGIITENIEQEFERFTRIFQERDERMINFLEQERTLEEIVDKALIYRDFSFHPLLLRYWEENMIQKHLAALIEAGRVKRTYDGFLQQ
jgi:glyoxylase-like metal-dependent hydrolase (beta-lactamase superfamily II)